MPVPTNASIRVRIIGGVKAALEAESVAEALANVDDNAGRAGRAAVIASFGLRAMVRQLRNTFTAANLGAVGLWSFTTAATFAKTAALGLATIALPALAIALWNVGVAAGVVAVTFITGMVAILGAAGVMALGVVDRFQLMRDVAGSAANDLLVQAGLLRGAFRDAMSGGADKLMGGLADGLHALVPLMTQLAPAFTALGGAIGNAMRDFLTQLAGSGPELSAMFTALIPAITSMGHAASSFLALFIQIATVGAPLVASALEWLSTVAQGWTRAFDAGTVSGAMDVLRGFASAVRTFFTAFAKPLKPIFGPAMAGVGAATKTIAGPLGTVLGTLLASLMRVGAMALPYVVSGIRLLARVLPSVIGWLQRAGKTIVSTFAPAAPFFQNVLAPLLLGIGKGVLAMGGVLIKVVGLAMIALGWLGSKLGWAKGIFEVVGQIIALVFAGGIFRLIGSIIKLIPNLGWLGTAFRGVGKAISGVWDIAKSSVAFIREAFGTIPGFIAGLATKIAAVASVMWGGITSALGWVVDGAKSTFVGVVNWLIGVINKFIKLYNGTIGKLSKLPGVPDITLGYIGTIGSDAPSTGGAGGGGGAVPPRGPSSAGRSGANLPAPASGAGTARSAGVDRVPAAAGGGHRTTTINLQVSGRTLTTVQHRQDGDDEDRG